MTLIIAGTVRVPCENLEAFRPHMLAMLTASSPDPRASTRVPSRFANGAERLEASAEPTANGSVVKPLCNGEKPSPS